MSGLKTQVVIGLRFQLTTYWCYFTQIQILTHQSLWTFHTWQASHFLMALNIGFGLLLFRFYDINNELFELSLTHTPYSDLHPLTSTKKYAFSHKVVIFFLIFLSLLSTISYLIKIYALFVCFSFWINICFIH